MTSLQDLIMIAWTTTKLKIQKKIFDMKVPPEEQERQEKQTTEFFSEFSHFLESISPTGLVPLRLNATQYDTLQGIAQLSNVILYPWLYTVRKDPKILYDFTTQVTPSIMLRRASDDAQKDPLETLKRVFAHTMNNAQYHGEFEWNVRRSYPTFLFTHPIDQTVFFQFSPIQLRTQADVRQHLGDSDNAEVDVLANGTRLLVANGFFGKGYNYRLSYLGGFETRTDVPPYHVYGCNPRRDATRETLERSLVRHAIFSHENGSA